MVLRCFLFSSDEEAAAPIRQVLTGLGVEGESCSDAALAVDRITNQTFQIVIIDWDNQPEAGLLLTAARERKAAERPITLAIVSNDASVPKVLQAGANSILRKPISLNQAKDTLTTARDLLRARQESAAGAAQAAAAAASASASAASVPLSPEPGKEKMLRAGEFLHSAPVTPGGSFVTETDVPDSPEQSVALPIDPLKDLEPVASSVAEPKPEPLPPPAPGETRGLEWYLKTRGATRGAVAAAPAPVPAPAPRSNPELLGFDQTPSYSAPPDEPEPITPLPALAPKKVKAPRAELPPSVREDKKEAELVAYMNGEAPESGSPAPRRFGLGKGAIFAACLLAAGAIAAAPQAPWHGQMHTLWSRGRHATQVWLNPQPVTPVQAPAAHEDFGRAGDEYKLPVAENIPDATTDPSQIQVLPVVDPTAKKTNDAPNPDPAVQGAVSPNAPAQPSQVPEASAPQSSTVPSQPASTPVATGTAPSTQAPINSVSPAGVTQHSDPPVAVAPSNPVQPKTQQPHSDSAPNKVPSSLTSQLTTMAPDTGGNKPPEAAMQSIEPVSVPEAAERSLLTEQPDIPYPANANNQQGTVVLQVLIGRDGAVQDAKFMQGSLAFARAAIEGVKQWKFKPYTMNGRAVSVQTLFTLKFKPGQ
jgi:TonB family protein